MTDQIVATATTKPRKFLRMSAEYHVAPDATSGDLRNDAACLLESIHGTVDVICDRLQEEGGQIAANPRMVARALYGVLYQIKMVQGALLALPCSADHAGGAA